MPAKEENIFLFVPNLIGYARIVFAIAAFYFMPFDPYVTITLYGLSELADAFDGYAARSLNQGTKFGALLDMLTDRCTTLGLLMILGLFYTEFMLIFQVLAVLDISSHWIQMYSSLVLGDASHKTTTNPILKIYYTSRTVLFIMCAGNEMFLMGLYMHYFSSGFTVFSVGPWQVGVWDLMTLVSSPIFIAKQSISVVQLISAASRIAEVDLAERERQSRPH